MNLSNEYKDADHNQTADHIIDEHDHPDLDHDATGIKSRGDKPVLRDASRALIIAPFGQAVSRSTNNTSHGDQGFHERDEDAVLDEARGLAAAINLTVADALAVKLRQVKPSTLLSEQWLDRIDDMSRAHDAGLVIIDHNLTPIQQRNLERRWHVKVIDRTGLILEIFGARAQTAEGKLQVELAALEYQRSRLVRSWTHLERQRGGLGFIGGPGESQLEIDRRLIDTRIDKIRKDLGQVRRTRGLHREARAKVPYPVVALVGYTNAGKSTLFNRLSGADVKAEDLLFATLDPTMRAIDLATDLTVILSDTVGFVSNLPTSLVEAFRATLEEVTAADWIIHVRDVGHEDTDVQRQDVEQVLGDLGIDVDQDPRYIEVLNKADLLSSDEQRRQLVISRRRRPAASRDRMVMTSAETGQGVDELIGVLRRLERAKYQIRHVSLHHQDGDALSWLYQRGDVLDRQDDEHGMSATVSMDPVDIERFAARFPHISLSEQPLATNENVE